MAYKMHMWLRKDMKYAETNLPKRNIKFLMQNQQTEKFNQQENNEIETL